MNEESLFAAALDQPTAEERLAFLDRACAGDARLRERVERLLAAAEASGILDRGQSAAALMGAAPPESPLAAGQLVAGRFVLRRKLGEGSQGEVWLAEQAEPVRRRVAVKVIRPGLCSPRLLARFDQECQALAVMDHPNIAKVLDAGVAGGRPFCVMELIRGEPITRHCDGAGLSPRERLGLFLPVCHAVQHAHRKGIIHRDLKPSNILVGLCDGKPVPKVIDFGIAKATGPGVSDRTVTTEIGGLLGTPEYMSPEQAEPGGLDTDTRADVYSLGAVLYELLTGTMPFPRERLRAAPFAEMLRIIKEEEPDPPSQRVRSTEATMTEEKPSLFPSSFRELDWIVMKCLEKERDR
ncbi:MAG TPA: serine/threonine-protein kinase, partial [Gemmataceae bacterium]|nr:serine/threonine-protein kinase [Gemmataceae bacterium]